ncbi:MAG: Retroviral aspartyl protease [Thaumarchaeota archaeon]|jgi:clan AA aspartic protease|nr:Retroviral aspartyl protease [Candidatus Terraquivivens yellowstonensis]
MGFVRVKAKVWSVENPENAREVILLVDTGAIYMVLPRSLLEEMGVKSIGKRKFKLANNQVVERDVGIIGIDVQGIHAHTLAVFGDEGTYLLGAITLEELGLEVDPVKRELRPMEHLLMLKQAP